MFSIKRPIVAIIGVVALLSTVAVADPNASEASDENNEVAGEAQQFDASTIEAAIDDLDAAGYEYTTRTEDDVTYRAYQLPNGSEFALPVSEADSDGQVVEPMVGGGTTTSGPYISFSAAEQRAIASGGTLAAVGYVCTVAGPACLIAGALGGGVASLIGSNGVCSNERTLRIEADWNGHLTGSRCV